MNKILIGLLCLLLSASQAWAQATDRTPAYCNKFFQTSQTASAISKVISGVTSQQIQVCGWALSSAAATASATMFTGTGTNCGTSQATLYPPVNVNINDNYIDHVPFVNQAVPTGQDLCLTTVGVGPLSVIIYFSQF